jgi:hypothetical protein
MRGVGWEVHVTSRDPTLNAVGTRSCAIRRGMSRKRATAIFDLSLRVGPRIGTDGSRERWSSFKLGGECDAFRSAKARIKGHRSPSGQGIPMHRGRARRRGRGRFRISEIGLIPQREARDTAGSKGQVRMAQQKKAREFTPEWSAVTRSGGALPRFL